MPPYRAQLSGIEGSGVHPGPNVAPDWASIVGAISGGASSLLQGAYLRKMAESTRQSQQAQRQFENDRQTAQDKFAQDKFASEETHRQREYDLKVEENRQKALAAGIKPASEVKPAGSIPLAPSMPTIQPGVASLDPATATTQGPPTPAAPMARLRTPAIVQPEHYDPNADVALQRSLRLKATPSAAPVKSPAETPGTPEHAAAVQADAAARARGAAPYRTPRADPQANAQHVAIRQSVQQARAKYMAGEKSGILNEVTGALSPLEANKKAMADAVEVYGEAAVRAAIGGGAPARLATPGAPVAPATVPRGTTTTPVAPGPVTVFEPGKKPVVTDAAAAFAHPDAQAMTAWAAKNPPQPGESKDAYKARYAASKGKR